MKAVKVIPIDEWEQLEKPLVTQQSVLENTLKPKTKLLVFLDKKISDILTDSSLSVDEKYIRYMSSLTDYLKLKYEGASQPTSTMIPTTSQVIPTTSQEIPTTGQPSPQKEEATSTPKTSRGPRELRRKILSSVPRGEQKTIAKRVLSTLENDDRVSWTESGQIMYDEKLIPHSNIENVVKNMIKSSPKRLLRSSTQKPVYSYHRRKHDL